MLSLSKHPFRILVIGVLLSGLGRADDDVVPDSATPVKFDFAQSCKVRDHTFILEKTTLADVTHAIGSGVIRDNGQDAGEHEFFVDYSDGSHLIRFSSNGEMGGDDHGLGEVEVRPLSSGQKAADFPALHDPVVFPFGTVGMPFAKLVAGLGPATKTDGVAWYVYSGKSSIKDYTGKTLDGDVLGTLRVKVVAGKVAAIQLGRVTSY
jgi:hypothetical protein